MWVMNGFFFVKAPSYLVPKDKVLWITAFSPSVLQSSWNEATAASFRKFGIVSF